VATRSIDVVDEHAEAAPQPEPDAPADPTGPAEPSERERELAVIGRLQGDLADVDRALERLDDGTYGTCEVCGEAIADDVLEGAPAARLCAAHAGG
jgi:DnaK suppressor protein